MKIIKTLIAAVLIALSFTGCSNNIATPDPLNNGSSKRNETVVISDIHMGADLAYSELNKNLGPLEQFLRNIRVSPNIRELIIAGDLIDEWFVPADVNTYDGKDQREFVRKLSETNKGVISAFNDIISDGKIRVTYVPGNHDLTLSAENINFLLPGINQARDNGLGLGTYSPEYLPQLAIEHGHRYNFFCAPDMFSNQDAAPGTIMPPGYFFTRIAALHVREKCTRNIDSIPLITPNVQGDESQKLLYIYSRIWKWTLEELPVNNHFNEKIITTNVNGFTDSYSVDDLIPYQTTPGGEIKVRLFNGIQNTWEERQTRNNVAVHIPAERAIAKASSADETDDQAGIQYFRNKNSDKRIVVFGHNHRAAIIPSTNTAGLKTVYANSGTWIDSNPGTPIATFLIITPQDDQSSPLTKIEAYSFENKIYTLLALNTLRL